jgi:hypothetical protein
MEHRWSPRNETSVPVLLRLDSGKIIGALVRNISTGGMLIDLGRNHLNDGEMVGVVWASQCPRDAEVLVQKAVVVHVRGPLAGLMFVNEELMGIYISEWREDNHHLAYLQ